jgi:hypothetical protein
MGGVFTHRIGGAGGGVASAPADIFLAVQDFTSLSTGTSNVTSSELNGETPKAAFFINSGHASTNDPTGSGTALVGFGAYDGASQYTVYTTSRSSRTDTAVSRNQTTGVVRLWSLDLGAGHIASASMVTNGVELDWTGGGSIGSRRCAMVGFAGDNVSAKMGTIGLGSAAGTVSVSSVGFQPDAVIFFGHCGAGTSAASFFSMTLGMALADETQRCVLWGEANNIAAGRPFQTIYNDSCGGQNSTTDGTRTYSVIADNFNSSGFDVVLNASAGGDDLHYLALKFTGGNVALVDFTTPTITGSWAITGAGFTPRLAIMVVTNLETLNDTPGSTSALQGGFGISAIGDEQWAASYYIDSGAGTTNTASQCQAYALLGPTDDDLDAIMASLTSFDSDGMTLNVTATQGTGKKGFVLFIE